MTKKKAKGISHSVCAVPLFGKMHFQQVSENQLFHEIKRNGITSFHGIHNYQLLSLVEHPS